MATNATNLTGEVKFYNRTKGYGFIIDDKTPQEFFFHVSGVNSRDELKQKDHVSFDLKEDQRGVKAVNIIKL